MTACDRVECRVFQRQLTMSVAELRTLHRELSGHAGPRLERSPKSSGGQAAVTFKEGAESLRMRWANPVSER
eukprot:3725072-Rhodomonas_salina.1